MGRKSWTVALVAGVLCWSQAATAQPCPGDCNGDERVGVGELITGVNISLGRAALGVCPAFDSNGDRRVSIGELIGGVSASLNGCDGEGVGFAEVQAIFTASCISAGCHSGSFPANNMSLVEGEAYDEIVDVAPFDPEAASDGLVRVDPGDPDNSYVLLKVAGAPDPRLGSQMPLFAPALSADQVRLIRDWIAAGAPPP